MIKALEVAFDKLKSLSEDRQRYAAEILERIASAPEDVYVLSQEEHGLIQEGLDELDRGEVVSDAEVRAMFDKYRT